MKDSQGILNGQFAKRLAEQEALTELLTQMLGLDPRVHKIYPYIKQRKLVLITERPELSSLLKQQSNAVLMHVKQHYQDQGLAQSLISVVVKTGEPRSQMNHAAELATSQTQYVPPSAVSAATYQQVAQIAEGIEDESLREALLALAGRVDDERSR